MYAKKKGMRHIFGESEVIGQCIMIVVYVYVCVCVCMYACTHECMCVCVYVHVCMYVCMYTNTYAHTRTHKQTIKQTVLIHMRIFTSTTYTKCTATPNSPHVAAASLSAALAPLHTSIKCASLSLAPPIIPPVPYNDDTSRTRPGPDN
jgi:hypothetical protein